MHPDAMLPHACLLCFERNKQAVSLALLQNFMQKMRSFLAFVAACVAGGRGQDVWPEEQEQERQSAEVSRLAQHGLQPVL